MKIVSYFAILASILLASEDVNGIKYIKIFYK